MEKKVENKENKEIVIRFETKGEEWKKAQDKEFKKLADQLKVDGFRQGHVPENIAKSRINQAEVMHEALFQLVNKEFVKVVDEEKLTVFSRPLLNVEKISADEMVATVSFALPPQVELGEYKGLKIAKEEVKVTEKDVEAFIENLQKEHTTLVVKEGEAKEGDTVLIDFKGYVDDTPFEGGEAKGYSLKLGSHAFIPGFEEALVGIKAGESREINVKFPDNYVENLAGKEAKFEVSCSDVKEAVVPEVNEDFVKELEIKDVETVDSLKKHAEQEVLKRNEQQAKSKYLDKLLDTIVEASKVTIGSQIIEEEAKANIDNMKKQVEKNGLQFSDYLRINNLDEEKLLEERKKEAEKNLKVLLVVEEICKRENIAVTDELLEKEYENLGALYGMEVEKIKDALEPQKDQFERQLRTRLFTEFLEKNND